MSVSHFRNPTLLVNMNTPANPIRSKAAIKAEKKNRELLSGSKFRNIIPAMNYHPRPKRQSRRDRWRAEVAMRKAMRK